MVFGTIIVITGGDDHGALIAKALSEHAAGYPFQVIEEKSLRTGEIGFYSNINVVKITNEKLRNQQRQQDRFWYRRFERRKKR